MIIAYFHGSISRKHHVSFIICEDNNPFVMRKKLSLDLKHLSKLFNHFNRRKSTARPADTLHLYLWIQFQRRSHFRTLLQCIYLSFQVIKWLLWLGCQFLLRLVSCAWSDGFLPTGNSICIFKLLFWMIWLVLIPCTLVVIVEQALKQGKMARFCRVSTLLLAHPIRPKEEETILYRKTITA